jgi:putative flippase GtrA
MANKHAITIGMRYALFALIATGINIGVQRLSHVIYEGRFSLYVAMFLGTIAGLAVKYVLDKRYIFFYKAKSIKDDAFRFILYGLMGVVTTFVFWGFELAFDALFRHPSAKYAGAVIGLTIGYLIKFLLDRKFVFKNPAGEPLKP